MIFRLPRNCSQAFVLGHFLAKKENRSFWPDRIPPNLPSKDGIYYSRKSILLPMDLQFSKANISFAGSRIWFARFLNGELNIFEKKGFSSFRWRLNFFVMGSILKSYNG